MISKHLFILSFTAQAGKMYKVGGYRNGNKWDSYIANETGKTISTVVAVEKPKK